MNRPKRAATQKPKPKTNDLDLSELEDDEQSDGDFSSQSSDNYDPSDKEDEHSEVSEEEAVSENSGDEEESESSPEKVKNKQSKWPNRNRKSTSSVATLRREVINKFKNSSQPRSSGSSQKLQDIFKKAEFQKFKNLMSDSEDSDKDSPPNFDCSGGLKLSDSEDDDDNNDNKELNPKRSKKVLQTQKSSQDSADESEEVDKNMLKMQEIAAKLAGTNKAMTNTYSKSQKENVNVADLLAMGETESNSKTTVKSSKKRPHASQQKTDDSDSDNWEDVEEDDTKECKIPKEGVEIVLNEFGSNDRSGKSAKPVDVEAQLKRKFNKRRKDHQEYLHKTELLSWFAHGNYVNTRLNDMDLIKNALKLLPKNGDQCYPKDKTDLEYFKQITTWFKHLIFLRNHGMYCTRLKKRPPLAMSLALQMHFKTAICRRDYVLIYITLLRAIGIQCRMVQSVVCDPKICPKSELMSLSTKKPAETTTTAKKKSSSSNNNQSKSKASSSFSSKSKASSSKSKTNVKIPQLDGGDNDVPAQGKKNRRSLRNANTENGKPEGIIKPSKTVQSVDTENFSPKIKITVDSPNRMSKASSAVEGNKKKVAAGEKKITDLAKKNRALEMAKKQAVLNVVSPRKTRSQSRDEPSTSKATTSTAVTKSTTTNNQKVNNDDDKKIVVKKAAAVKKDTLKIVLPRSTRSRSKSAENENKKVSPVAKPNLQKLKRKAADNEDPAPIPPKTARLTNKAKQENPSRKRLSNDVKDVIAKKMPRVSTKSESDDDSLKLFAMNTSASSRKSSASTSKNTSKIDRRILSSDDEEDKNESLPKTAASPKKASGGIDIWVEVYSEKDERWVAIDVFRGKVDCAKEIAEKATHPIVYVFAWNNDNSVKDVSARYCPKLNTTVRKMRVDREYINSILQLFAGTRTPRDFKEDDELNKLQLKESMPTSIAEFKNHPLYALRRHLLKFQAIYPPEPPILGYIREEAIYPRDCVFVLHTREKWVQEARVVKMYEKPYKMSTTMKWDRAKNKVIKDVPLELFGIWQTKEYEPPVAENGLVPRNGYGNVEMFKPCMLPIGCVHLQLPALNRTCKKLGVDCAQAVVGFDSSGGWPYPVYDGFVICKEFEEKVVDAWNRDQDEMEKKEREKYEKRVYGNWKKLIKGLFIRERLKNKYNFEQKD